MKKYLFSIIITKAFCLNGMSALEAPVQSETNSVGSVSVECMNSLLRKMRGFREFDTKVYKHLSLQSKYLAEQLSQSPDAVKLGNIARIFLFIPGSVTPEDYLALKTALRDLALPVGSPELSRKKNTNKEIKIILNWDEQSSNPDQQEKTIKTETGYCPYLLADTDEDNTEDDSDGYDLPYDFS